MKLNYEKCKHCKYFIQHYNIDFNWIYKVCCGHCSKNISTTGGHKIYSGKQPCPYFEKNRGEKAKVKKGKVLDLLKSINLNIELVNLYLNKNKPKQLITDTVVDWLNSKK